MDVLKSSRFWIMLVVAIGSIILAALGKVSGELAGGILTGLLGGFGTAKAGGKPPVIVVKPEQVKKSDVE